MVKKKEVAVLLGAILLLQETPLHSTNCVLHQSYQSDRFLSLLREMGEGKAIPLQAWTGPEGSGSLRLQDFKTIGT